MPYVTSDQFQQFTYPRGTGGRVVPVCNGYIYLGVADTDPMSPENQLDVYVIDEEGNRTQVGQPVRTNDSGVPVYNGSIFNPFIEESRYSISVLDSNKSEIYSESNQADAGLSDLLNYVCIELHLPTTEAGVSVDFLLENSSVDNKYGLVAPDGSVWINPGYSGTVTKIPAPFLGIVEIDRVNQALIKDRDENRYQPEYDYKVNNLVIGPNDEFFLALKNNGPSFGGAISPVDPDPSGTWKIRDFSFELDEYALLNGNEEENFSVKTATEDNQAVNLGQLKAVASSYFFFTAPVVIYPHTPLASGVLVDISVDGHDIPDGAAVFVNFTAYPDLEGTSQPNEDIYGLITHGDSPAMADRNNANFQAAGDDSGSRVYAASGQVIVKVFEQRIRVSRTEAGAPNRCYFSAAITGYLSTLKDPEEPEE